VGDGDNMTTAAQGKQYQDRTPESTRQSRGALARATSLLQEMPFVLNFEGWLEAAQIKKSGQG